MLLIRDKKKPEKEPFHIGERGFQGLQKKFPGRYVIAGGTVSVEPEGIKVTPVNVGNRRPSKRSK